MAYNYYIILRFTAGKRRNMLIMLSIFSYATIFLLLTALAYRDLKDYILPDRLNAALAASFILFHILTHWLLIQPVQAIEGAIAGGGLLLLIRFLAHKFYRKDSLGLGDVKLMTAAGLGLGYPGIFMALSIGALAGLLHGFGMALYEKIKNKHNVKIGQINVPAGVGLAIGIAFMMLYQFGIDQWLLLLKK